MAVKKSSTAKKEEVKVEVTPTVEVEETVEVAEEVTEEVTVETEEIEENKGLEVDTTVVAEEPKVKGNVRVRMNKDHQCFIGGEHYVLTAGQCYNVPANVKEILNRAGLLAPL